MSRANRNSNSWVLRDAGFSDCLLGAQLHDCLEFLSHNRAVVWHAHGKPNEEWKESMWCDLLGLILLAFAAIRLGAAEAPFGRMLLPIEVLGADGTTESRTVLLDAAGSESVRSLWLQVNGLRYPKQAS